MILGIVGAFGDTNFGDYAMLVNNIYSIQPKECIVFTYNKEFLEDLAGTYLKNYKISQIVVENTYKFEEVYSGSYQVHYDDEALMPTQILQYINNEREVREAICRIDILFVCGGGFFNRVWNAKHRKGKILSILGTMLIANEECKKIVFGSNTFGPFDESEEFYRNFFLSLQNVVYAARDDIYSISNLRKMGIKNEITLLPDDLYFLHEQLVIHQPNIQITLPEKYIVLELYCSLDEIKEHLDEIDTFIDLMNQRYKARVVFVSLDRGFGGEKQGELFEGRKDLNVWQFGDDPYRKIEDVLYIVRHAQFVVCQRYHLFLFSIANNIPAYQILKDVCGDKRYYYAKSNGMLRQVFCNQEYEQNDYMAHSIREGIQEIAINFENLIQRQQNRFNYKKKQAEAQMKRIQREYIDKNVR
ncbi:MAG: polysaccharide pyruvyl transferase family protein [Dorea sp.]|nr:polysaccharide pyruvyl transferase family protein [Dorea sp.]